MAYTEFLINDDGQALCNIFNSMTSDGEIIGGANYAASTNGRFTITLYYDAGKTQEFFKIAKENGTGGVDYKAFTYTFTAVNGQSLTKPCSSVGGSSGGIKSYMISRAYLTDYGIVITVAASENKYVDGGFYMNHAILITKNQNNMPVVVFNLCEAASGASSTDNVYTVMNKEYAFASTDTESLDAVSRPSVQYNAQTSMTPFFTRCGAGLVSYTPNAGRLLTCPFYKIVQSTSFSEMTFDGAVWLTNGCWCLKAE